MNTFPGLSVRRDFVFDSVQKRDRDVLPSIDTLALTATKPVLPRGSIGISEQVLPLPSTTTKVYYSDGLNWIRLATAASAGCSLADVCVGPGEDYTTFTAALAAGFNRVRITGDITEPAGTIVLPTYVHIWVDGEATWTIPPTTTIDASGLISGTIEGNTRGTLAWSPSVSGQLMGPASNITAQFSIKDMIIDISGTTAATGPIQLWAQDALQFYENCMFILPNIPSIQLIDLTLNTVPTSSPAMGSAITNIEFVGTGTAITHVIGNIGSGAFAGGHFTNLMFSGTFPAGNAGFAFPLIEVGVPSFSNGNLVFDGIATDTSSAIYDLILAGNVTNILKKDDVGITGINFHLAYQGSEGSSLSKSTVNAGFFLGSFATVTELSAESVFVSGNDHKFTGCTFGTFNAGPFATLSVTSRNNIFNACTIGIQSAVPSPGILVSSTAINTTFTGCFITDSYTTGADRFMLISGSDTVITGCNKLHTGAAFTNLGSLEVDGGGDRTIITGFNMTGSTTGASPASTVVFTGTPSDVLVVNNMFDNVTVGAVGGASIIAPNIVL
uniref:Uncharacterized protein n=1 Tax=Marseillevirus LCMAC101 TaxID=2506602 RepID=A0A481YT33_9VIRU|nr:MAG: hypothetical protein LCMAC101_06560 [Marseillevirus LCMAC101]